MRELDRFKKRTGISDPTVDMLIGYVDRGWARARDMSYVKTEEDDDQLRKLGVDIDARIDYILRDRTRGTVWPVLCDEALGWRHTPSINQYISIDRGEYSGETLHIAHIDEAPELLPEEGWRWQWIPAEQVDFRPHRWQERFFRQVPGTAWCAPSRGYGIMTGIHPWTECGEDMVDGKWQNTPEKLPPPNDLKRYVDGVGWTEEEEEMPMKPTWQIDIPPRDCIEKEGDGGKGGEDKDGSGL